MNAERKIDPPFIDQGHPLLQECNGSRAFSTAFLVCACGRWMHTEGVDEQSEEGGDTWMVRSECLGCGLRVGLEAQPELASALVDRLVWTDDARYRLERMPPYTEPLVKREVEEYARRAGWRVVTAALMQQARQGGAIAWDPEAEQRLDNVPAPIRSMARLELERTALEREQSRVTVSLMEEVKAKYFGMGRTEA